MLQVFPGYMYKVCHLFFSAKSIVTSQIYFNVVNMGKKWHAYEVLVGKPEGKR
jgi:hypothetical protein